MGNLWCGIRDLASRMQKLLEFMKEESFEYLSLYLKPWFTLKSSHVRFGIEGLDTFITVKKSRA